MKRRIAIKSLGIIGAGMALFPGCSDGLKIDPKIESGIKFTSNQKIWVEAISEAILPKKDLILTTLESFPDFVAKMIMHQKSKKEQESFIIGYNKCTEDIKTIFNTSASDVGDDQIVSYFKERLTNSSPSEKLNEKDIIENALKRLFCEEIRRLCILHITTSREYQTEILEYKLIPGPFNACVAV